jgi:hypothetical protein
VIRAQPWRAGAPSQFADAFEGDHSMATDIFSGTAPDAEEESLHATWTETAVTAIFSIIAVLIVASISVIMAMA